MTGSIPKELGSLIYKESGFAVKILIEEFGEDKLRDFIKKIKGYKTVEDLRDIFFDVFKMQLSYEYFNRLLK